LISFGAHRRSDIHAKSVELAAAQAARDKALAVPPEPRVQQFAVLQKSSLEQEQQEGPSTHHPKTQAEQEMWAGWDLSNNTFEIGDSFEEIAYCYDFYSFTHSFSLNYTLNLIL